MFNVKKIQDGMYGVVGLRQPYNPEYQKLDADNLISRSGLYATDNPLVKIDLIYDNIDYKELTDAQFNEKIKQVQQDSITSVCNSVFVESSFIDRQVLYKNAQNKVNIETLPNGFVGFEICVSSEKNVAFKITRIMLDFVEDGDIELLLFNTSETNPILSKEVSVTNRHQVETLNWVVDNSGETYKGKYYLGYIADGSVRPYKQDYENSDIKSNITYLDFQNVAVKGHTDAELFDLNDVEYISEATGLNPDITVYEDYTDLILNNEQLFAQAINLDFQISLISLCLNSLRSNRNERESERLILQMIQNIEGQKGEGMVTISGLRPRLYGSIKTLRDEIEKIHRGYFGGDFQVITMR